MPGGCPRVGNFSDQNWGISVIAVTVVVGNAQCSLYGCWGGTATAGEDYTARTSFITIPAGSRTGTVEVPILDDTEDEYAETFMVAFKSRSSRATCEDRDSQGNIVGRPGCSTEGPRQYPTYVWSGTVTIYDDDDYPYPPPAVSVTGGEAVEGDTSSDLAYVPFLVSLDKTTTDDVTVMVNTSDGTATAGEDYTPLVDYPVTIRAGSASQRVWVYVIEDRTVEPNETFTVTVSDPVHAVLSPFTTATGTIYDDDTGGYAGVCGVDAGTGNYRLGVVDLDYSIFGKGNNHIRFGVRWEDPDGTTVANVSADITTGVIYTARLVEYYRASGYFGWITASRLRRVLAAAECSATTVEQPPWQVSVSDWTAYEDDGVAHVTITFNRPAPPSIASATTIGASAGVTLDTRDGTAIAGSDYTAVTATKVDFTPGHTQATAMVPITDDTLIEPDETFTVAISNPVAQSACSWGPYGGGGCIYGTQPVLDVDTATITIIDNDDPAVSIEGPVTATEGSQADFKIKLDKVASAAVVVTVSTGTDPFAVDPADAAGNYRDYTPLTAHQVTIPAGSLEATASVSTADDDIDEFDETFLLRIDSLTSTADVQVGADDEAEGTITDDDAEPDVTIAAASSVESSGSLGFTVSLSHASQKLTNVTATTSAGTAFDSRMCATTDGSEDYQTTTSVVRFASYVTTGVFDVRVCDDTATEPDETFTVTLSSPTRVSLGSSSTATGTILDDDVTPEVSISDASADESSSITFNLALDVASPLPVTVTAATAGSSPVSAAGVTTCSAVDGSEDYQVGTSTVTFAPLTRSATFTVTVCDDAAAEPDETFEVMLSSPTNARVGTFAGTATGTIVNNDHPPVVSVAGPANAVDEDTSGTANTLTFTISLDSAFTQTVTVTASTASGSATGGTCGSIGIDFADQTATVTFSPGIMSQTFVVSTCADTTPNEGTEDFTVTISSPTNATLGTSSATGEIADNDNPPVYR